MKRISKWIFVFIYTIGIVVVTPYLPQLIRSASLRWSSSSVSRFVLFVEIALGVIILIMAVFFLIHRKKKSILFLVSVGIIFLSSVLIYKWLPNPYEFTHLPEYAVFSILTINALENGKKRLEDKDPTQQIKGAKEMKSKIFHNSYLSSGIITGLVGTADEIYQYFLPNRHFLWYDILLNTLGAVLGLLIVWGIKK